MRKVGFLPVLMAITTKGCVPVTPVAPLGSTPNLVISVICSRCRLRHAPDADIKDYL